MTNSGISRYNGLSLQFRRALGWGFQGQISYTWSHALDDISNGGSGLVYSYSSLRLLAIHRFAGITAMPTTTCATTWSPISFGTLLGSFGIVCWTKP